MGVGRFTKKLQNVFINESRFNWERIVLLLTYNDARNEG